MNDLENQTPVGAGAQVSPPTGRGQVRKSTVFARVAAGLVLLTGAATGIAALVKTRNKNNNKALANAEKEEATRTCNNEVSATNRCLLESSAWVESLSEESENHFRGLCNEGIFPNPNQTYLKEDPTELGCMERNYTMHGPKMGSSGGGVTQVVYPPTKENREAFEGHLHQSTAARGQANSDAITVGELVKGAVPTSVAGLALSYVSAKMKLRKQSTTSL